MFKSRILFLLFSTLCGTLKAQDNTVKPYPFVMTPLSGDMPQDMESMLDERNFIITSELHYNKYSLEIKKKFILYLASIGKLDKIGLEQDYAFGYEVNHFFKTEDTLRLKKLFDFHWEMTVSTNTADFYKFFVQLKQFSDSIHFNLDFYGIDVVLYGGFKGSVFSINNILSECDSTLFQNVVATGHELLNRKKLRRKPVRKWIETVEMEVESYKRSINQSIPKYEFIELENIIYSVKQSLIFRKQDGVNREKIIAANLIKYCEPDEYFTHSSDMPMFLEMLHLNMASIIRLSLITSMILKITRTNRLLYNLCLGRAR